MRKILEQCPTCGHPDLIVTTLECPECRTEIRGAFVASRFCRLSEESLQFLETFVRNRGNLKEMERELHIPYTTLRNRLLEIITEMGYGESGDGEPPKYMTPTERQIRRREILQRLAGGEIDPEEAIEQLRRL